LALLPESAFAFAGAKIPAGAVTTSLLLLFVLLPVPLRAQHVENPQMVIVVPKSQLEKDLQSEIICMCGTCVRKRIGECTCSDAAALREEVANVREGGTT